MRWSMRWWLCGVALATGCTPLRLPAFDPTGERIFLPPPTYTTIATPFGYGANPPPPNYPYGPAAALPPVFQYPPPLPAPGTAGPLVPYNNGELTYNPLQVPSYPVPPVGAGPGIPPISPGGGPPPNAPQQPLPPPGGYAAYASQTALTDGYQARLSLNPQRLVAPVGQEVVLQAGLCASDGYLITRQPIEWSISPDSVGTIVEVDQNDKPLWRHLLRKAPRKFSGQYAVGLTSEIDQVLPRGNPGPQDDIQLAEGQTWITVSSASEGATHITAVSSTTAGWEERRQNATIHWVDGQWLFPTPVVGGPTGGALITRVNRATNGAPIEGWKVRYEILTGTPAAFDANGSQAVEIATNAEGIAAVQITPTAAASGATEVRTQIIRMGTTPGDLDRLVVGENTTSVTWTDGGAVTIPTLPPGTAAPPNEGTPPANLPPTLPASLYVDIEGPGVTPPDAPIAYRITVSNRGSSAAENVEVASDSNGALQFIRGVPAPVDGPAGPRWQIGTLGPGESRSIDAEFQVLRAERVRNCVRATAGTAAADDCAITEIRASALRVELRGPGTARVNEQIPYQIVVTNLSPQPLDGVLLRDTFGPGLQNAIGPSPLDWPIGALAASETKTLPIRFTAVAVGRQCHTVEVSAADGSRASDEICVEVESTPAPSPPPGIPPAGQPGLQVLTQAPPTAAVNQETMVQGSITNSGSVPLTNVEIRFNFPAEIDPIQATAGHQRQGNSLVWVLPRLEPGQQSVHLVKCMPLRESASACVVFDSRAAEGASAQDDACITVTPSVAPGAPPFGGAAPGGPALSRGLAIRVARGAGSPEGQLRYDVEIDNPDQRDHNDVVLQIKVPEGTEYVSFRGPPGVQPIFAADGRGVDYSPISTLRIGERIGFQIFVTQQQATIGRLLAQVSSRESPELVRTTD